jgi:hypothetical protein
VFLELFPSSSRAQRHWKVAGKKGKIYIYRRHSAGGGIRQPSAVISALVVPYVNRQYCVHLCWRSAKATHQHWYLSWRAIKPTASTLVWISLVGTQFDSTTHSHTHTLAPNPSHRHKQLQPTLSLPPPLVSFARAPPPQLPSENCRPTLQPPVPRATLSRFTAVAWRAALWRRTLANSCLCPCWSARRVGSG